MQRKQEHEISERKMEKTSEKSQQPQFPVYDLHVFYVRGTDRDDTDHGCFAEPL